MSFISPIMKALGDFIFPKADRVAELEALSARELMDALPQENFSGEDLLALFDYGHPLTKELVWQVKYAGNRTIADKLAEILYDVLIEELEDKQVFEKHGRAMLVPIPISDKRRFERGWNQTELLSERIESRDASQRFKYIPHQLIKIVHTESQTKTESRSERQSNLLNTMRVADPHSVSGKFVILVDDVFTTGSTFAEARRALKEAGAKKVLCVAVAH